MRSLLAAVALLNGWRFYKTRDLWFLGLGVLFALGAFNRAIPAPAFTVALGIALLWVVWLAAWRFVPALRIRKAFGSPNLERLNSEERDWRGNLPANERKRLEIGERWKGKRFTMPEAVGFLEGMREGDRESTLHDVEQAAYEAEERSAAAEREDLETDAVNSALEAVSSTGSREWLKLERVEDLDEDDAYRAPIQCAAWAAEPAADDGAKVSFTGMTEVIGFPPDDIAGRTFWASASPEFKRMFRSRCLVAGVDAASDSRERFDFKIEDKTFVIMTKYLGWRTDLALDDDRQRMWVRISGMNSEVWSSPDVDGRSKFEGFARIPAFLYPIPVDRLMPSMNPGAHFPTLEAIQEGED